MHYINFDHVAEVYDSTRAISSDLLNYYTKAIKGHLERNFSKPYKILSIGIGTGRTEGALHSLEIQLFGIDISLRMLKVLYNIKGRKEIGIAQADGCTIPFRGQFDLCIATHVTHLIPNWAKLFSEIRRISKTLLLGEIYTEVYTTPLFAYYKDFLNKKGWKRKSPGLRPKELVEMLEKEGHTIEKHEFSAELKISNAEIYDIIVNRYFSSFWRLPNNLHSQAIDALCSFIQKENISMETKNKVVGYCNLFFCKNLLKNHPHQILIKQLAFLGVPHRVIQLLIL